MRGLVRIGWNDLCVQPCLVAAVDKPLYILVTIHHLDLFLTLLESDVCIQLYARFPYLSFLRRDNHNAVCTSWTVNCSGRCILQYLDTFYIGRVQQAEGSPLHRITVYNIERVIGLCDRSCSTNFYRQSFTAGSTIRLLDKYTRNLSGHCFAKTYGCPVFQVFGGNRSDCRCYIRLFLCTVTDNDHFFQHFRVFIQFYADILLSSDRDFTWSISDVTDQQYAFFRDFQCEISVHVCYRTVSRPFFNDIGSDNRFAIGVIHLSGDFTFLCLIDFLCWNNDVFPFDRVGISGIFQHGFYSIRQIQIVDRNIYDFIQTDVCIFIIDRVSCLLFDFFKCSL